MRHFWSNLRGCWIDWSVFLLLGPGQEEEIHPLSKSSGIRECGRLELRVQSPSVARFQDKCNLFRNLRIFHSFNLTSGVQLRSGAVSPSCSANGERNNDSVHADIVTNRFPGGRLLAG